MAIDTTLVPRHPGDAAPRTTVTRDLGDLLVGTTVRAGESHTEGWLTIESYVGHAVVVPDLVFDGAGNSLLVLGGRSAQTPPLGAILALLFPQCPARTVELDLWCPAKAAFYIQIYDDLARGRHESHALPLEPGRTLVTTSFGDGRAIEAAALTTGRGDLVAFLCDRLTLATI